MEELYPAGPVDVPAALKRPTSTYRRQAWFALLGLLAFVAVYCFLCFWFARIAYVDLVLPHHDDKSALLRVVTGVLALILALFLLKGLLGVTRAKRPSLPEIERDDEPELFAFLGRVADEVGAPRPHRVFLSPGVNASVSYDVSLLNLLFASRKNLEIGLGLVNALTLSELKGVLGHEFGHFAQRSMAVGRWVYVAEQVAGQVVVRRDWFDAFLLWLSRFDIRVGFVGWILRLVVWSLRALIHTGFTLVVLAQRALGREMEFQADLVAVSVAGSDAIVHALHRLHAADGAFDHALEVAARERRRGRRVPDLYALQTRTIEHLKVIHDDSGYGEPPSLPETARAGHRVFEERLAQPPRMWSTHPSNREREDNAKRHYLEVEMDQRSAWLLFSAPEALRARMTAHVLGRDADGGVSELLTDEEAAAALQKTFSSVAFDRAYRGAYLNRTLVLHTEHPDELVAPVPAPPELEAQLTQLYPPELAQRIARFRALEVEVASLEALRDGMLDAPGGMIRYRGRVLKRPQLPGAIDAAKAELAVVREELGAHDRQCRSLHRAAAASLGAGWPEYLDGLMALLHYAGHTTADVADAHGHLANVFAVVTADGNVSHAERARLVDAAQELHSALERVSSQAKDISIPLPVCERLGIVSWTSALPIRFELDRPTMANIGHWLNASESWLLPYLAPLRALERAVLEDLLQTEATVKTFYRAGVAPVEAPAAARVPEQYVLRLEGMQRKRQRRLGLYDRVVTGDGFFPTLVRFGIAAAIVGPVLGFGAFVEQPQIIVYNALDTAVAVSVGETSVTVRPKSKERLGVQSTRAVHVVARTAQGDLIEDFVEPLAEPNGVYVYNVASASPFVEWTAVYDGSTPEPARRLENERFFAATADDVLEDPPERVRKHEPSRRRVLKGFADSGPRPTLRLVSNEERAHTIILAHARHDAEGTRDLGGWLEAATFVREFEHVLPERLRRTPRDVVVLRAEQDAATRFARPAVCARHTALAAANPDSADLEYLAVRCLSDGPQKTARFREAFKRHPTHPYLAFAVGTGWFGARRWAEAAQALWVADAAPAVSDQTRALLLRIRRASPGLMLSLSDTWFDSSEQARELRALESGQGLSSGPLQAYSHLARGDLAAAVEAARTDAPTHARVLRLAAASDGAARELVQAALALPDDEGMDQLVVWPALALALREGKSTAGLTRFASHLDQAGADELLVALEKPDLFADSAAVDTLSLTLVPPFGHYLLVMGAVVRDKAAPAAWRSLANAVFFSVERPYFR